MTQHDLGPEVAPQSPFRPYMDCPASSLKFLNQEVGDIAAAEIQPALTRMMAQKAEMERAAIHKQLAEEEADKKGELWTMQASLTRRGTSPNIFVLCKLGSHLTPEWAEAFASQHQDAILILNPMHVIGSRAEVLTMVGQMWKCDEYDVRFIT